MDKLEEWGNSQTRGAGAPSNLIIKEINSEGPTLIDQGVKHGSGKFVLSDLQDYGNVAL